MIRCSASSGFHAHTGPSYGPHPSTVASDVAPASLRSASGLSIKIQLLSPKGRALWPVERHRLVQRYSDAPVAELLVPTLPAFVASKTVAWHDRGAPRDLWDLWALSEMDAIDAAATELYRQHGPTNRSPAASLFDKPPDEADWQSQLGGQTRLTVTAAEALHDVRDAWFRVTDRPQGS